MHISHNNKPKLYTSTFQKEETMNITNKKKIQGIHSQKEMFKHAETALESFAQPPLIIFTKQTLIFFKSYCYNSCYYS